MPTIDELMAEFDALNGRCRDDAEALRQRRLVTLNGVPSVRAALVVRQASIDLAARKRLTAEQGATKALAAAEVKTGEEEVKAREVADRTLQQAQAAAEKARDREHEDAERAFEAKVKQIEATISFPRRDTAIREARQARDAAQDTADLTLRRANEDALEANQNAFRDAQEKHIEDLAQARHDEEAVRIKALADEQADIETADEALANVIEASPVAVIIEADFRQGLADLEARCEAGKRVILDKVRAMRGG